MSLTEERVREIVREERRVPAQGLIDLYADRGILNRDGSLAEGVHVARDPQDGSLMFVRETDEDFDRDSVVVLPARSAELDHFSQDGGVALHSAPKARLKLFLKRHARAR